MLPYKVSFRFNTFKQSPTINRKINNPKTSLPVVSWKDIQDKKYIKAIDSAMLINGVLPYVMKAKAVGSSKYNSELLTVIFDKEYVENWIATKLIRPLANYGVNYVTNLVTEAWLKSDYST